MAAGVVVALPASQPHDRLGLKPLAVAAAFALVGFATSRRSAALAATPGLVLSLLWLPHHVWWVPVFAAMAGMCGAVGTSVLDEEQAGSGLVPGLFGISATGLYFCVPDTEQAIRLACVAIGLAALAAFFPRIRLGRAGAGALVGLFVWISAAESIGRPAAVIGATAALAVLLVGAWREMPDAPVLVLAIHGATAVLASRLAGTRTSAVAALVISTVVLAGAAGALEVVRRRLPLHGATVDGRRILAPPTLIEPAAPQTMDDRGRGVRRRT